MRTRILKYHAILMIAFSILYISGLAQTGERKTGRNKPTARRSLQLFNGKNLSNWVFYLKDNTVSPADVFYVKDGIIHITGSPFGYMRTKATYSNYRLHVEWRWPSEATNSGIFVHCQTPDAIWLKCIECQLQAGNAGDFVCMNGAEMNEHRDKSNAVVKKKAPSSEKPAGEWNTMEIVCSGNTVEVYVNGVFQNKATKTSVSSGSISLQSEGKDVEFRNVYLTALK